MLDWTLDECVRSVPKGWAGLIYELYMQLHAFPIPIKVYQIKEKFGGLRFYYEVDRLEHDAVLCAAVAKLVQIAEGKSYGICEDCGGPGGPKKVGYWITAQCEACNIEALEARKNLWKES